MHDFVLSFAVGAVKPQAEIYAEAIRRAQCAQAMLFTDDVMAYGRRAAPRDQPCNSERGAIAARVGGRLATPAG
jgi:hypothetical protein